MLSFLIEFCSAEERYWRNHYHLTQVITVKGKKRLIAAYLKKLQESTNKGLKYCFQKNDRGPQELLSPCLQII